MKFGYCVNMTAKEPGGTGIEHLGTLEDAGYDYVELPCAEMTALSEAEFSGLVQRVHSSRVPCEASNNFFPRSLRLTGPDVDDVTVDAYVDRALHRLERLEVRTLVFGSGGAKNVPEGFPLHEGYRQVVDLLKRIAPKLAARGITLAIEPLRREECNLINTFAEGVQLARDVNEGNVRVLVDYYHLCEENEPVSHVAEHGREFLRHVHFARQRGRVCPRDPAEDPRYEAFFEALQTAGYDGRISCEAYAVDFDQEARGALDFLRTMTDRRGV